MWFRLTGDQARLDPHDTAASRTTCVPSELHHIGTVWFLGLKPNAVNLRRFSAEKGHGIYDRIVSFETADLLSPLIRQAESG